jgi:hypothetical protein
MEFGEPPERGQRGVSHPQPWIDEDRAAVVTGSRSRSANTFLATKVALSARGMPQ